MPPDNSPAVPDGPIHGSCVAHDGRGVLIVGASGAGKSSLALHLMSLGAGLVADDRVILSRRGPALWADVPAPIRGRIEARGVGLMHAPCVGPQPVALVVDLDRVEPDRLPRGRSVVMQDVRLPLVLKVDADHFPAAIMLYLRHGRDA